MFNLHYCCSLLLIFLLHKNHHHIDPKHTHTRHTLCSCNNISYIVRDNFIHDNEDDGQIPPLDDLPPLNHVISDFEDTPYLTPGSTQLMREISLGNKLQYCVLCSNNNQPKKKKKNS